MAIMLMTLSAVNPAAASPTGDRVNVIIREVAPATDRAERLVERLGGAIGTQLELIGGFAASVPADAIGALDQSPAVGSFTLDRPVAFQEWTGKFKDEKGAQFDAKADRGSVYNLVRKELTSAETLWGAGFRGQGVGVALIDTGVSPVDGLLTPGKVVNGPDLSFESQDPTRMFLDTYGHGTHMAGIIAGRDLAAPPTAKSDPKWFFGMAPDSHIVSVKVAGENGAVDVSQIIAAIDWVVQHRNDPGLNIRVLNLSFGVPALQDPAIDPLSHAVEVAWRAGITVVVAAGNDGNTTGLRSPATNPYVIVVGAADQKLGDVATDFSSCGLGGRGVDLLAPGRSVAGLRVPNAKIDTASPEARAGTRFFKGSGTSQSAAVVSGAVALIISQRPGITPDQVKELIRSQARPANGAAGCVGAGSIDLERMLSAQIPAASQTWPGSTGSGSLDLARGGERVVMDGVALVGEQDIFGSPFDSARWAADALAGRSWSGGTWNGRSWSGSSWSGTSWSGSSWSGSSWSGSSWSGSSWSGSSWSSVSWLSER